MIDALDWHRLGLAEAAADARGQDDQIRIGLLGAEKGVRVEAEGVRAERVGRWPGIGDAEGGAQARLDVEERAEAGLALGVRDRGRVGRVALGGGELAIEVGQFDELGEDADRGDDREQDRQRVNGPLGVELLRRVEETELSLHGQPRPEELGRTLSVDLPDCDGPRSRSFSTRPPLAAPWRSSSFSTPSARVPSLRALVCAISASMAAERLVGRQHAPNQRARKRSQPCGPHPQKHAED